MFLSVILASALLVLAPKVNAECTVENNASAKSVNCENVEDLDEEFKTVPDG